ncbi:MAG: urease accessory protein UreF [Bradymonadia bacterium]
MIELSSHTLYALLTWMSPGYPVGAYTYSHGVEWAVEQGEITDGPSLQAWIEVLLRHGGGHVDAVMLSEGWLAVAAEDDEELAKVTAHAHAFRGTQETALESQKQGEAFVRATLAAWPSTTLERWATRHRATGLPYAIAVGVAAAAHNVPLEATVTAHLHAFAANLVSAGVRLVPLGQTAGQQALAALAPIIHDAATQALSTSLEEVSTAAPWAELASIHHETQHVRLFRS